MQELQGPDFSFVPCGKFEIVEVQPESKGLIILMACKPPAPSCYCCQQQVLQVSGHTPFVVVLEFFETGVAVIASFVEMATQNLLGTQKVQDSISGICS